jgi:serine/threonine protein phosphatase PrpC
VTPESTVENKPTPVTMSEFSAPMDSVAVDILQFTEAEIQQHTISVDIQHAVNNMNKGQDYVCSGETICAVTGLPIKWAALYDGHGSDVTINHIRGQNMAIFAAKANPAEELQDHLLVNSVVTPYGPSSGSTMLMAKVYDDHVDILSVGDSQIRVYDETGNIIEQSVSHDSENAEERARLQETRPGVCFVKDNTLLVLNERQISSRRKDIVIHSGGLRLAPTQALGHRNRTGIAPYKRTVVFQPGKRYRIVGVSDGVLDMAIPENPTDHHVFTQGTAEEIVKFYTDRWLQIWEYKVNPTDTEVKQTYRYQPKECDDVSAFVINIA